LALCRGDREGARRTYRQHGSSDEGHMGSLLPGFLRGNPEPDLSTEYSGTDRRSTPTAPGRGSPGRAEGFCFPGLAARFFLHAASAPSARSSLGVLPPLIEGEWTRVRAIHRPAQASTRRLHGSWSCHGSEFVAPKGGSVAPATQRSIIERGPWPCASSSSCCSRLVACFSLL
jgi:hypothetical protein